MPPMKNLVLTLALLTGGAALAQTSQPTPAPQPATTPATSTQPAAQPSTTQSPDAVVARVGNQTLTLADFDRSFRVAVAGVVNAQGLPLSDDLLAEFASSRPEYLKQFVREQALTQLARASVKPDAAAIDAQLAQARAGFGSDADFQQALTQTGYGSADDLRAGLERQAVIAPYLQSVQKRFTFGDAIVNGYYNLHRDAFTRDAEACVKHILVATEAEAKTIVTDLSAGKDFAAVAKAKSQDPGSAAEGGDLGCIAPGDTVAAFDKASFSGPLNQPQVVQTEYGWHVLTVSRRSAAGLLPLTEAAPLIREQLSREAAQKYLDAQIARIKVETFPDVVKVAAPAGK
ncbi:peptidyl-prolyl cis-trans isomerase [Deinococcus radiodurans R1 = ATCC 13939 = DSM 20539]|uniref:Peptidyl-prolyl cis-trans isomerase C n=2 Tax=Deinococcus radiodurans TaxID=1299 RepID=Q9RVG6_DEIRA|nr:peptidyl-prolyl cis-trans isomerase C [Deinococcus radiodurans R1 = ATCC 13939 = DSM 20539]QEM70546.1 peptidyl-prolyl cis-trans isomerase [Deinococcus radiodurans]UDL00198.1 peptidyl-prolyl cis-trans isomerase [Deinococcus radiodurans R1 = ATCC 13939 = DSM 20539]HCE64908.1 peptidyl-prolyl cis-trans isomerase [Deinococcus radiodurans]